MVKRKADHNFKIFTGTSNPQLADSVATALQTKITKTNVKRFSDGEIQIELLEHVRESDAFIIQSTCAPANDTLMELLLITDSLRRSSANRIYAVIPYFGYARQDRRAGYSRVPISAKLVADVIQTSGVNHVVTLDLHAMQIQGFFNIPVDNISAMPLFSGHVFNTFQDDLDNVVIVSPDIGGVARARAFAKPMNFELAIIDKRRPKAGKSEVMNIIGDVKGKTCIMVDDMIDTAGTLCNAAEALMENGKARSVHAYCTHPVLSGRAIDNISKSVISSIVVTDTIALKQPHDKIVQISVAGMLAETIERIHNGTSISSVFE